MAEFEELSVGKFADILCDVSFDGWSFRVRSDDGHPFLQVVARTPDATRDSELKWSGRKWRLSSHMTRSEVVQTALKAVLTAVEHEARETFRYKGHAIFGPHFDVDKLADLCAASDATEVRQ